MPKSEFRACNTTQKRGLINGRITSRVGGPLSSSDVPRCSKNNADSRDTALRRISEVSTSEY